MPKMGRVVIDLGYVVYLDDAKMIARAKRNFYDDIMNLIKNDEIFGCIDAIADKNATEEEIPEFLLPEVDPDMPDDKDND